MEPRYVLNASASENRREKGAGLCVKLIRVRRVTYIRM